MVKVMICENCCKEIYSFPCVHCDFIPQDVTEKTELQLNDIIERNTKGGKRFYNVKSRKWVSKKKVQELLTLRNK